MPEDRPADDIALEALRWCCATKLVKQTSVAAHLEVSPSAVNRWISGDRRPASGALTLGALFIHLGEDAPKLGLWLADRLRQEAPRKPLAQAVWQAERQMLRLMVLFTELRECGPTKGWWSEVEVESRYVRDALVELEEADLPAAARRVA